MSAALFVGIDGGATKTLLRLEDEAGRTLGSGQGGAANIRLSVDESWRSIDMALGTALREAGLSREADGRRIQCVAGLAGSEVRGARDRFLLASHGFARLTLVSDGIAACRGAHRGEDGAIIAVGTGVIGFQVEEGREGRVGGWGFPHSDEGSGASLGLEAIRRTLQRIDGRADADPLTDAVRARFGDDDERLVAWANAASATEFAEVARPVIEAAMRGVPLALDLLREAAGAIDRIGKALARKAERRLPCVLLGGIAPFLEPFLGETLRARLVPCRLDAVGGALLMAREARESSSEDARWR